jgi:hypothetical protein
MSENGNKGYSVGYRKPPKHSQFQKGQSGNPKGRPNGLANNSLSELFEKILSELVSVNEDGQRTKITKLEALIKQVIHNAISKGSGRDAAFVLSMIPQPNDHSKSPIHMLREMAEKGRLLKRQELERQSANGLMSIAKNNK